ncbi:MAG: hypothetical protein HDQ96_05450 [Lachnospiraceae bacterium]|nr:hypothetical protein [Lachnospiraceae bacterium]
MKQIGEKQIDANGVLINFEISIKKIIEYDNCFIVLIRERKEIPNNIIAYDYYGNELWKINDIVRAKISRGYDDIEKMSNNMLKTYYELGIVYEIDLDCMKITNETYMR